jgi:lipid IVA palmitoyltransferase
MMLNFMLFRISTIKLHRILLILIMPAISATAFAEDLAGSSLWSRVQDSLSQTWQSENYELYIPVNTWHNRSYYTKEQINNYNEQPWGLGVGKYRFDSDGDWSGIYAMAFLDSHRNVEPVAGYGFQKIWHPSDNFRIGAGYTAGFSMRERSNYIPFPIILPLLSAGYKQLDVQTTYVPGGKGNGNILFTWLRWKIE